MSLLDAIRHRIRVRLRPRDYLRQIDEEMEFHLSLEAMQREHAARGTMSAADARWAARRRFGNLTTTRARTRHMAGLGFFDAAIADLRFALRSFRRTPGFTAAAVLTLALGIGADTAIFSAVHAMLLRPLPFLEPDRLMKVTLASPPQFGEPANDDRPWSYPKYVVFRDAQRVYSDLALYDGEQFIVTGGEEAERDLGERVGARYFPVLGVRPALGRAFAADEDSHPDGPRVVVLGDAFWRRRFGADPAVLGKTLMLGGEPHTIVGVLPPGFRGLSGQAELWAPLMGQPEDEIGGAWSHRWSLVARLAPGVTPDQAKAAVKQLGERVYEAYPNPESPDAAHWGAVARELDATRVDPRVRQSLLVLSGAVALLLLLACANVANLFLVRAAGRRREIAVRLAIGAGRRRLVRQLLTESVVLSALGGVASVAVAWWGVKLLGALDPATTLRAQRIGGLGVVTFTPIGLDLVALAFAGGLAVATGLLFGLVPALQATRPSLTEALAEGKTQTPAPHRSVLPTRSVLAALEIAIAIVLLAGSGLMLRSLGKLLEVSPGFASDHVLTMRLSMPFGMKRDSMPGFHDRLLERLSALPGVAGVAISDCPPVSGGCNGTVAARRDRPAGVPGSEPVVGVHWATPGWFDVMRVPLRRGRLFDRRDVRGAPKAVLVNETAARTIWPGEDPIGRPVSVGQGGFWDDTAYVVGVVGDVRWETVDSAARSDVYLPYAQSPNPRMMLFVRTTGDGDPMALAAPVRAAFREMAADAPVYDVRTLDGRLSDATAATRFSTVLLTLFGLVALTLAAVGTYGVIAYATVQRTQEIGIRMALGAGVGDVTRLVVSQGVAIAIAGGVLGVAGALATTRVLRSLLYGVEPNDPVTFAAILAMLAAAVLAANWIPARRAARIDPAMALREG